MWLCLKPYRRVPKDHKHPVQIGTAHRIPCYTRPTQTLTLSPLYRPLYKSSCSCLKSGFVFSFEEYPRTINTQVQTGTVCPKPYFFLIPRSFIALQIPNTSPAGLASLLRSLQLASCSLPNSTLAKCAIYMHIVKVASSPLGETGGSRFIRTNKTEQKKFGYNQFLNSSCRIRMWFVNTGQNLISIFSRADVRKKANSDKAGLTCILLLKIT